MGTYNGLEAYKKGIERRNLLIMVAAQAVCDDRADKVANEAKALLSGSLSTQTLAQMGHPFARQHFTPRRKKFSARAAKRGVLPAPLTPINRQSGRLYRAVRVIKTANGSAVIFDDSVAPYWRYVLAPAGTKNTIGRGFQQALAARMKTLGVGDSRKDSINGLKDLHRIIVAIYRST